MKKVIGELIAQKYNVIILLLNNFNSLLYFVRMSKAKPVQTKKYQTKMPQIKVQPKKQTEIDKYFRQISPKSQIHQKVLKQAEKGENNVVKSIQKGKLEIKQAPTDLTLLILQEKVDTQQEKAMQIVKKRQQILEAIEKLDMRSKKSNSSFRSVGKKYSNPDLLSYKPNGVLSRDQHEQLVQKILKAQQIQDQRNQERLYQLQKQLQQENQKLKKLQEEKIVSQKQLRRKKSQYNLSLRRQISQIQEKEQQKSNKQLLQIKKRSYLHDLLEQQYNNSVTIPTLQEKKKKLKEIRDFARSFKVKDLNDHEKQYLKERNKSMHLLNSKTKINEDWNYKPPAKTEKLSKILEEELSNRKKDLQKHQKAVEEKILREQNYIRILKELHTPKIDQSKQQQVLKRIQKLHTRPRQIVVEPRQKGREYLVEAKKMKKQQSEQLIRSVNQINQSSPQMQSSRVNYLNRKDQQFYSKKRVEELDKILKSADSVEKVKQLQIESKKLEEAYKRKQQLLNNKGGDMTTITNAAELLLSGIKAKLALAQIS